MKMKKLFVAVAVMSVFTVSACSTDGNTEKPFVICPSPGISLNARQAEMVTKQNTFAWRMLSEVNAGAKGCNSVCSPLSMVYCLGMVNTGATGNTSEEITKTLGFGSGTDDINQYCKKLMTEMSGQDKTVTLNIANCVEVNSPYVLEKDYKTKVTDSYNALVENRQFSDSGFKNYINGWVKKQTDGMIPQLLENIDPDAVSYIINALYFKGVWAAKFDKALTQKSLFNRADGSMVEVDMMHQTDNFPYFQTGQYQAVSLGYGNNAYSMQVLLPTGENTVSDVIAQLSKQDWRTVGDKMSNREVSVYLPKFTIEYGGEMNDLLKRLGINTMFSPDADFSNFCKTDTYISKVIQKAKIEVDEEGTKAAAATAAEVITTSVQGESPIQFLADHPFVYVITERSTGTIIFAGVYTGRSLGEAIR